MELRHRFYRDTRLVQTMHPGRIAGVFIGVLMLGAILLLPFSDVMTGPSGSPETLWRIFMSFVNSLGTLGSSHASTFVDMGFLYQIAAILLIVGCIVGIYPVGSGVLGAIGMSFVTFGPYEVVTNYASNPTSYSVAFYLLWVASIVQIVLGLWAWRVERRTIAKKEAVALGMLVATPATQGLANPSESKATRSLPKVCPACGTANPINAIVCSKCRKPL